MPVSPIAMLKLDLVQELPKLVADTNPSKKGKFEAVLKAAFEKEPPAQVSAQQVSQKQTPVHVIVNSITKSEKSLNDLVSLGLSGQKFSTQQLLMMQAGVYRATIAIDVVSKGVEQTTGGLKTLLQSQV